jgi:hypothetical protein
LHRPIAPIPFPETISYTRYYAPTVGNSDTSGICARSFLQDISALE